MTITALILFIMFGWVAAIYSVQALLSSVKGYANIIFWFFSIFVTAIAAGVIWGGLFQ